MMFLKLWAAIGLSILTASAAAQDSSSFNTATTSRLSSSSSATRSASSSASTNSSASSSSSSSSSTTTSSAAAATKTVSVGADGLNYSPNKLTANVGDIIEFRFYPQNHSVARAEYKQACIPYEDTGAGKVGFWSGFEPIAIVSNNPPIFNLLINDTEPIFFYCSSPGACMEGMIGVINENATQTLDVQLEYALNATLEFSPNEYFPKEVAKTTEAHSHKTLSGGAIAGIVIGGVAVLALAAAVIYMCGRHRTMKEIVKNPANPQSNNPMNHHSYMSEPAMSEAHYPNKLSPGLAGMDGASGRFSPHNGGGYPHTETDSFRSRSPPVEEMGMVRNGQYQSVHSGSQLGSPGFPSPSWSYDTPMAARAQSPPLPEMEHPSVTEALRAQQKEQQNYGQGPIELPVPSRNASMNTGGPSPSRERPFSYTDSESGYAGMRRDER
ncbi:extracellular serine-rich protein [Rutstroemia sp. NJR-2017a WRK4]|nr:extracellular serine-rich protein [Rutstroemia sp. NJR-2017a WRK4]